MRSGSAAPRRARGLTYLGLLVLLALQGAALAALGRHVSTAMQREREAELLFRGEQIRTAIARYHAAVAPGIYPASVDDLLVDRREGRTRHHLRRLWPDPFTGRADWEWLREGAEGRIVGVMSRSAAPRWRRDGPVAAGEGPPRVRDWRFVFSAIPATAAPPAPAAQTRTEGDPP